MITNNEQLREFVRNLEGGLIYDTSTLLGQIIQALTYALGEIERLEEIVEKKPKEFPCKPYYVGDGFVYDGEKFVNHYACPDSLLILLHNVEILQKELTRIKNIGVEELGELIYNNYGKKPKIISFRDSCEERLIAMKAAQAVLDLINGKEVKK